MTHLKLSVFAMGSTSLCGVVWSSAETIGLAASPPSGVEPSDLNSFPSIALSVCSVTSWMRLSFFLSFLCTFFGVAISSFGIEWKAENAMQTNVMLAVFNATANSISRTQCNAS